MKLRLATFRLRRLPSPSRAAFACLSSGLALNCRSRETAFLGGIYYETRIHQL